MTVFDYLNYGVFLSHAGHGSESLGDGNSLLHYLLEPNHAPMWMVGTLLLVLAFWLVRNRYQQRVR